MGRRSDNTGEQNDDGGHSEGDAFSESQRRELDKILNGVQSTYATRLSKSFDTKLGEKLGEMREGFAKTLDEKLSALSPTRARTGDKGDKGGDGDVASKLREEYEARMREVEAQAKSVREEAEAERSKAREQQERAALREQLREAGVPDGLLRGAVAALYVEDRRVARDDDGNIVFKAQRAGFVDELDLSKGIAEWLDGEEGKHYRPARAVAGSGASGPRGQPRRENGKPTRSELKQKLVRAVLESERLG